LVDALDSGSSGLYDLGGSSPPPRTNLSIINYQLNPKIFIAVQNKIGQWLCIRHVGIMVMRLSEAQRRKIPLFRLET
jgi:hypothetical protein